MIDPEFVRARDRDRALRTRIDPLVDGLTIAGRLELLTYIAATVARDATHELRAMFAEPVSLEKGGECEEARKPLPASTVEQSEQTTTTNGDTLT